MLGTHCTARDDAVALFLAFASVTLGVIGHMSITLPFFVLSRFFYKEPSPERSAEINKFFNNIDRVGNTTAASIPIALDEAVQAGRLGKGDHLLLAAFGSGT